MAHPTDDNAQVIAPPPLIYLGFLSLGLVWHFGVANDPIPLDAVVRHAFAIVLGAAGVVPIVAALGSFRRAGTPPQPWEPTQTIVTTGIYGRTRNPMYLGMASIYLALALVLNSVAALVLFVPVILVMEWGVIWREERYLTGKFGAVYTDYQHRVRRWI